MIGKSLAAVAVALTLAAPVAAHAQSDTATTSFEVHGLRRETAYFTSFYVSWLTLGL